MNIDILSKYMNVGAVVQYGIQKLLGFWPRLGCCLPFSLGTEPSQSRRALPSVGHFVSCHPDSSLLFDAAAFCTGYRTGYYII